MKYEELTRELFKRWPNPPDSNPVSRLHHAADVYAIDNVDPEHWLFTATSGVYGFEGKGGVPIRTGLQVKDLIALSEIVKGLRDALDPHLPT